jgi:ethanolamine utilization microcompartment shell protein EutL
MPSRQRRSANNKSARCGFKPSSPRKDKSERNNQALFQSPKRPSEYPGYRAIISDRAGNAMPILIGAAIIAAAILLSTLITAVGTRFVGMESPSDETVWLIDRLTGNVYKCQAIEHGKATCETDIATGSIGERGKR